MNDKQIIEIAEKLKEYASKLDDVDDPDVSFVQGGIEGVAEAMLVFAGAEK